MAAPALIYLGLNLGSGATRGWGVPMATDIAFAVGVLTLLGRRVPAALRVLLLAVAIIDDIGAILVIALFYSSGFSLTGLAVCVSGVAAILALQRFGVRNPWVYVAPGFLVWFGLLLAGVHPTLSGVIVGMLTPVRSWYGEAGFAKEASEALAEFHAIARRRGHGSHELLSSLDRLKRARREALAPVVRIEANLHPWVAYGIMPLFALANAGVTLDSVDLSAPGALLAALGVSLGLAVGKPVGVLAASFLAVKLGWSVLPQGVDFRGLCVVGLVAGVGFTMALFIAQLAFHDPNLLSAAKLAVLLGSGVAGVLAIAVGRFLLREPPPGTTRDADEAERSTRR
jgi:NhaA family Na+:H+ antiporter